ncbi:MULTISPECIES: GNAT family N-acetyltransferase [unclassified Bradyrhizobium]|uniref:GNAT family N-acetyltransferase n=1 Tax=unclassified Bradyrhizobium TaxID=2631580 RepID=UPI0028EB5E67|nr:MULTISPECIES: GNAT family N-acetyltransferase [unclassified Bradyrhizobium]
MRPATVADTTRCVELLRSFHGAWRGQVGGSLVDAGANPARLDFSPDHAERVVRAHLRGGFACAFILDVEGVAEGLLLAAAFEHSFAPLWIAKETAWWIEPQHRGSRAAWQMLDAYESWARERGCVFGGMAGMGDHPYVGMLYRRRSYVGAETHYLKAL